MNDWRRIGVGMLAVSLVVSCGGQSLPRYMGAGGAGAVGVSGGGGRAGAGPGSGSGSGGQSGAFGPGAGGSSPTGTGGGGATSGGGATNGGGATSGGGASGGGRGSGGTTGTGGAAGRGGGGRGGVAGTGGGTAGHGGQGGTAGHGGQGGTAGNSGRGGMAGNGGQGGAAGAGCSTCRTSILQIQASDLVYNPTRNELYASVPENAAAYPNTILVVDPNTASITSAIPVGSAPEALALSDDGSTLWVGINGAHAFRKVTMSATPPVVGPLVHLPMVSPNAYFDVASMAVLPGQPLSVVVVLSDGSYTNEVRVYDDGVPRATAVTDLEGSPFYTSSVIAGPPGTAFGIDGATRSLFVYTISPSGITATANPYANLVRDDWRDSLAYVGTRVFAGGGGEVIDVADLAAPSRVGNLPYPGLVAHRDPMSLLTLTIVSLPFPAVQRTDVRIYASATLSELATVPLSASVGALYAHLVYAGGDAVAFIKSGGSVTDPPFGLVIVHDPAFGAPNGGSGGAGGTGGTAGTGGAGGTGGVPDRCPGCTAATVQAYGHDMVVDPFRNLIYLASDATAPLHPSSLVTVDAASAQVTSLIPVGNDPESLALSDDGSALWVGLVGERRVRRLTPGATPVPGPAYSLPMLLTTGEAPAPVSIAALPGMPASIAVGVQGSTSYGRGVFILDDGQPRANFIQPPEVTASFLTNGPSGYLLGIGDNNNLVVFQLGTVGATMETYGGLFSITTYNPTDLLYNAGAAYVSTGEVIDLTNPDAPVPAGRFAGGTTCKLAIRSATRVMMLCPDDDPAGPTLYMLDNTTFTTVGALTLPGGPPAESLLRLIYLGGDAVALLENQTPLQIVRAPMIASPP